jgi:hypothetical protein
MTPGSFGDDLQFLKRHSEVVVLEAGPAQVVVAPAYQGRVLTSTSGGAAGPSFGWINREVIASMKREPHMNVFGGEDRFWLGPEGGQYGLYFAPGAAFDFDHWEVPEAIDWGAWDVVERATDRVSFRKDMKVANHSATSFSIRVNRTVSLSSPEAVQSLLGAEVPKGTSVVAYESSNTVTNIGQEGWTKAKGLVSVWILGMFQPSPNTTIVLPFRPGSEKALGPIVNDAYFGKVPPHRLVVREGVLFFRGDGQERGKIGIPRPRALPIAGSWDAGRSVLTLVEYTLPADPGPGYVNSMWEKQKIPYGGDVVNSYNDGPPGPGKKPLGPFYEIETSSPAAPLAAGNSLTHVHRTLHIQGPKASLDAIAKAKLGVGLDDVERVFARQ